jgi:hypothetical protein
MKSLFTARNIAWLVVFFISLLLLLSPAIRFGYPVLHGDSGVNIISGFERFAPVERPVVYSIFLWITSLGYSLWFTVLAQAVLTAVVLFIFLNRILKSMFLPFIYLSIILILSITTSIGYFTCQIKPDFLLPLVVLSIYSLLISDGNRKVEDVFLGMIVVLGLISHLSHLPVITGLFTACLALSLASGKFRFDHYLRKYLILFMLIISAWIIAPSINYLFTGSFTLSRVSNIFSTSRLIQAGVFQAYVHDKCKEDPDFRYCKYDSDLDRYTTYYDFLWDSNSFLYDYEYEKNNRQYCWLARNKEFGEIVDDIYSEPKYLKLFLIDALKVSINQLFSFNIPDQVSFKNHSFPPDMARQYLPADRHFIENSRQNSHDLTFPVQNILLLIITALSSLFIILALFRKRIIYFDSTLLFLGYSIFMLLIGNAFFVGIFAGNSDRFQSRVIWLIPLYALVILLHNLPLNSFLGKKHTDD